MAQDAYVLNLLPRLKSNFSAARINDILPSLTKLMPADHIVFGSDFPAASPLDTVNGLHAFGLSDDALAKITRQNAQSILAHLD